MPAHRGLVIWLASFVVLAPICGHHDDLGSSGLQVASFNEVFIQQERGRIPVTLRPPANLLQPRKSTPEMGGAGLGTAQGGSAPVTCNASNASSPACYTATQQGRGR